MKRLLQLAPMIFVCGCATNTPSGIDMLNQIIIGQICEPIYGRATDWDVISDDLARNIFRHNELCEKITSQ